MKKEITINWTPEQVQEEALKSREILFKDPISGFDYASEGVRTNASAAEEEKRVNAITNNLVKFTFISHRQLIMIVDDNEIILQATNKYGNYKNTNEMDNKSNNPYLRIAREIKKYININEKRIMTREEITKRATAIQRKAEKMINTIAANERKKEEAIKSFVDYVSRTTNNEITLQVYESPKGRLSIDFKYWNLFKETHPAKIPGKYNVNAVAQKIVETYDKSKMTEECVELPIENSVDNSLCDAETFIKDHTELMCNYLNLQSQLWKTSTFVKIGDDIISCDIKKDKLIIKVSNSEYVIETSGKSPETVKSEIKNCLTKLIVYAAINSETRDRLVDVISEDSLLKLVSSEFNKQTYNQPEKEKSTVVKSQTVTKKYNKRSVKSFNNDVEKHLNVMYDSLDTYTPDKIKHELKNLFRRQFKCFNESDFMSVLDDNNKKTFRDYCELCETTNVA